MDVALGQNPADGGNGRAVASVFRGADVERDALRRNGFVVTGRSLHQHFSAYEPAGEHPFFVTTDAVLHTYAYCLTQATLDIDRRVASLQRRFTSRLLELAIDASGEAAVDAARFLGVGLSLQGFGPSDRVAESPAYRDGQQLAARLREGRRFDDPVFDLEEGLLRVDQSPLIPAESDYAAYRDLRAYFEARRFFQLCRFAESPRGKSARAVLARWIAGDQELAAAYALIQVPYRRLFGSASWPAIVDAKRGPPIASPQLRPSLLPPCEVPSSIVFRLTTHPNIEGRVVPSGMDLLAVGPFASQVGRALFEKSQAFAPEVLRVESPQLPDCLLARALSVLDQLTAVLPPGAPGALRTRAWQEKQCATQLAAWAELRMAARLHGKIHTILCRDEKFEQPPHRVSPYPAFFEEVGELARSTAEFVVSMDRELPFDPVETAKSLGEEPRARQPRDPPSRVDRLLSSSWRSSLNSRQRRSEVSRLLDRAARGAPLSTTDLDTLRLLAAGGEPAGEQLMALGAMCFTLSGIAARQLDGKLEVEEDQRFLDSIGEVLARVLGYSSNSWRSPRDDLPDLTVVARPMALGGTYFHVGVARPRLLILRLPYNGEDVLYQGAVSSYREFRAESRMTTDEWRESCATTAPVFTPGQ